MRLPLLTAVAVSALLVSCGGDKSKTDTSAKAAPTQTQPAPLKPSGELAKKPKVQVPSGPAPKTLQTSDLVKGKGPAAKAGDTVAVQYVGVHYRRGREFDSSWKRGQPFEFSLGTGGVVRGWDQGIQGMRVGTRRRLVIPAALAYGAQGYPPDIRPNEPLVFVVDLVGIR